MSDPLHERVRVLIDASQLTGQSSSSGIGSYVRGLLDGLTKIDGVDVEGLVTADATLPPGVIRRRVTRRFRTGRPAVYEHEVRRTLETRLLHAGVFHNPNPHAPRLPSHPWIQTLHDVIPLVVDDPVAVAFQRRFARFGPRYALADRVIAVSRHAADEGIRLLGIRASRLEVIPHGVNPEFAPALSRPDVHPPYLVMVCEYSRRKGLGEAIGIIDELADAGYPHVLRIAGRVPPWVAGDFNRLIRGARHPDRIEPLGFVEDLPSLYQQASVSLVTSRYEGFGFPALEAMACAVPVVSFDNTSLPEVVGDGGILVTDGDVMAATHAVRHLLDDEEHRAEVADRALTRASRFTWERSAQAHAEVYGSVTA